MKGRSEGEERRGRNGGGRSEGGRREGAEHSKVVYCRLLGQRSQSKDTIQNFGFCSALSLT